MKVCLLCRIFFYLELLFSFTNESNKSFELNCNCPSCSTHYNYSALSTVAPSSLCAGHLTVCIAQQLTAVTASHQLSCSFFALPCFSHVFALSVWLYILILLVYLTTHSSSSSSNKLFFKLPIDKQRGINSVVSSLGCISFCRCCWTRPDSLSSVFGKVALAAPAGRADTQGGPAHYPLIKGTGLWSGSLFSGNGLLTKGSYLRFSWSCSWWSQWRQRFHSHTVAR